MNKVIMKCGCCGIKVATTENDTDPICANCLEWFNNLEAASRQQKEVSDVMYTLHKSLNKVKSICEYLETFEKSKVLSEEDKEIIGSIRNMVYVANKGIEYARRLEK
jgi:hypothetical protein